LIRLLFLAQSDVWFLIRPGINAGEAQLDRPFFRVGGGHAAVLVVNFQTVDQLRTTQDGAADQQYSCCCPSECGDPGWRQPCGEPLPGRYFLRPWERAANDLACLLSLPLWLGDRQLVDQGVNFR